MATITRLFPVVPAASVIADGDLALTDAGRELRATWRVSSLTREAEIDAAYEEARELLDADRRLADERAAIEARFHAAAGNWTDRMRALQAARDFDAAHPSRTPLFEELHAEQLYGQQYGEVA